MKQASRLHYVLIPFGTCALFFRITLPRFFLREFHLNLRTHKHNMLLIFSSTPNSQHKFTFIRLRFYTIIAQQRLHILYSLFLCSNGSVKHLDSSSDSELDTPVMQSSSSSSHHHHSLPPHHHSSSSSSTQSTSSHLHLSLNNNISTSDPHHSSHTTNNNLAAISNLNASLVGVSAATPSLQGKSALGAQIPPLSAAVAYSHLHSVMGSMPIYDMGDYQHL